MDPTKDTTHKTKQMNKMFPTKDTTQKTKQMNKMYPTKDGWVHFSHLFSFLCCSRVPEFTLDLWWGPSCSSV
jgi:hypothetical protein